MLQARPSCRVKVEHSDDYSEELKLKEQILDKCVTIIVDGVEFCGFVVEVRVAKGRAIVDFAGAYGFEEPLNKITSIKTATTEDVNAYCNKVYNPNKVPGFFKAIKARIEKTIQA